MIVELFSLLVIIILTLLIIFFVKRIDLKVARLPKSIWTGAFIGALYSSIILIDELLLDDLFGWLGISVYENIFFKIFYFPLKLVMFLVIALGIAPYYGFGWKGRISVLIFTMLIGGLVGFVIQKVREKNKRGKR